MSVVAKRNHLSHRSIPSLLAGLTLTLAATVSVQATQYKVIYSFPRSFYPEGGGLIRDLDGNFLGTASFGGTPRSLVFKITPTGTLTVLHSFAEAYEGTEGGLVVNSKGIIYGPATGGGDAPCKCGFIYSLSPNGTFEILYSFTGGLDGKWPQGRLALDPDGNLYGLTDGVEYLPPDGHQVSRLAVLFTLSPQGSYRVIHRFKSPPDGVSPFYSAVFRDSGGSLYGTTGFGGAYGHGTIFKVSPTGQNTILHSFNGYDGDLPLYGVIMDKQGNLYGTARKSTASNPPSVVFRLAPSGALTTTTVQGYSGGSGVSGELVRDTAGNTYGMTNGTGSTQCGLVYKITSGGQKFILHQFGSSGDGCGPEGRLSSDKAGHLFGMTRFGGKSDTGVVFELSE